MPCEGVGLCHRALLTNTVCELANLLLHVRVFVILSTTLFIDSLKHNLFTVRRCNIISKERAIRTMLLLLDRHRELCLQLRRLALKPAVRQQLRILARQTLLIGAHASEKRDRLPRTTPTSRPPDAVDVVLDFERERVVDDHFDAGDVEAAGCDVGRDHHVRAPGFELFEGGRARLLFHVAMKRAYAIALAMYGVSNAGCLRLVQCED